MWFTRNAQIYIFCILDTSNTGVNIAFLYADERLLYVNEKMHHLFLGKSQIISFVTLGSIDFFYQRSHHHM